MGKVKMYYGNPEPQETKIDTKEGGRLTICNNINHMDPDNIDMGMLYGYKENGVVPKRSIHADRYNDGRIKRLRVILDHDYSPSLEKTGLQMKALFSVVLPKIEKMGYRGVNLFFLVRTADDEWNEEGLTTTQINNVLLAMADVAPNLKASIYASPKECKKFHTAKGLVENVLKDCTTKEKAQWTAHIVKRYGHLFADDPLSGLPHLLQEKVPGGDIWIARSESRRNETVDCEWDSARRILRIYDIVSPSEEKSYTFRKMDAHPTMRLSVWSEFNFEDMTMKVGTGKIAKKIDLKFRQLAYMMALGGDVEDMVRDKLDELAEKNPFMKDVKRFMQECALLIRAKATSNRKVPALWDIPFMPMMLMKDLMNSKNWNDYFRKNNTNLEKAGCNFNKLNVWQSVGIILASNRVADNSLSILFNDAAKHMRELGRNNPDWMYPNTILESIIRNRCPQGDDPDNRIIIKDYLKMCTDRNLKVSLLPQSITRYRELHDQMADQTKLNVLPELKIPENSAFSDLAGLLPPRYELIVNKERLFYEGKEMHHCVGSGPYHGYINKDESAIVAIKRPPALDENGKEIEERFTIEIRRKGTSDRFSPMAGDEWVHDGKYIIGQIYGVCDTKGSPGWEQTKNEIAECISDTNGGVVEITSTGRCALGTTSRAFDGEVRPTDEIHLKIERNKKTYRFDLENGEVRLNDKIVNTDSEEGKTAIKDFYMRIMRTVVMSAGEQRWNRKENESEIDLEDWKHKGTDKGVEKVMNQLEKCIGGRKHEHEPDIITR